MQINSSESNTHSLCFITDEGTAKGLYAYAKSLLFEYTASGEYILIMRRPQSWGLQNYKRGTNQCHYVHFTPILINSSPKSVHLLKIVLIDGLQSCRLLMVYCDVFISIFWRHPFTAEDPMVSKWLIYFSKSVQRKKHTHLHLGWPKGEYIFGWTIPLMPIILC